MQSRKKEEGYTKLGSVLKKIYDAEVALEPNHLAKREVLEFFLAKFREFCLKHSPEFRKVFKCFYLTGSYFEELRVRKANEFDVNIVLYFSPEDIECEIDEVKEPVSYATYRLKQASCVPFENSKLGSFFDDKNYLIGNNVRKWFQSLVDLFIKNADLEYPGLLEVKTTESGPARTVKVCYTTNFEWISIDLVPVFLIDVLQLCAYTLTHVTNKSEESLQTCVLVPKPLKKERCSLMNADQVERVWRIHFPEIEKNIIKDKPTLKTIIKLIKDLRDKEEWPIPSYFIKVVAFWLVKKHPEHHHWKDSRLGILFLKFLKAMEEHLAAKHLDHILYPGFNLLHVLNLKTMNHLQRRIHKMILELQNNPNNAYNLFTAPILVYKLS